MDWLFNILAWLLPTNTVDGAVSFVQKAIDRLAAAEAAQAKQAMRDRTVGEQYLQRADEATEQSIRAARIRRNLAGIIDG